MQSAAHGHEANVLPVLRSLLRTNLQLQRFVWHRGRQYVAIKGSKLVCGATLQIMNRSTGETKTVTVIDEGPYANDAIVDISEDVFGIPAASTWHVCIGPISSSSSPAGWKVCQQGSQGT
jgi:hypothetical protein